MSDNLDRPLDLARPHDGWYNGNPKLQIANGTFEYYLPVLEEWVKNGKMDEGFLNACKREWKQIPLEEKIARRDKVVTEAEPVPVRSREGKIEYLAKPSNNGPASRRAPNFKKKMTPRRAKGSIASLEDPFAKQKTEAMLKDTAPPVPVAKTSGDGQLGNAIPAAAPKTVVVPPAAGDAA